MMSLSSDSVRVDGPAKMSVWPAGGQFRLSAGLSSDGAVGGLGQSSCILAHRVTRDSQLACGLAQGEALALGLLHRLPESELSRRESAAVLGFGFPIVVERVFDGAIEVQAG